MAPPRGAIAGRGAGLLYGQHAALVGLLVCAGDGASSPSPGLLHRRRAPAAGGAGAGRSGGRVGDALAHGLLGFLRAFAWGCGRDARPSRRGAAPGVSGPGRALHARTLWACPRTGLLHFSHVFARCTFCTALRVRFASPSSRPSVSRPGLCWWVWGLPGCFEWFT